MKQTNVLLIVGADSSIGQALAARLRSGGKPVLETTRRRETLTETRIFLDLTQEKEIENWNPPAQIETAYLCAAVTSLAQCNQDSMQSAEVNVRNTISLARNLISRGTFVVFLSTNQVYDGSIPFRKADDRVCPQNEYGRQKAEAEKHLLALGNLVSIARFTKVLNHNVPLFQRWIQELRNNRPIHPFLDMVMAPVPLFFAVDVLSRLAELRLPGIIQVSGEQDITYDRVAYYITRQIGANLELVKPIKSKEAGLHPEFVPLHTTLDTTQLRVQLGLETPNVWSVIDLIVSKNY
ncbi:MAG: sugar nucleotide-binding protein [Oscillatoriales cyanobacterium RU_3_3]|nr:sugar nucleotide-binding protein [Oscillatoriales cyanobacterium RU_3_3]NJR20762.1 sugar nucleotide-binding protein [Richelia sp. CSU_2_1]